MASHIVLYCVHRESSVSLKLLLYEGLGTISDNSSTLEACVSKKLTEMKAKAAEQQFCYSKQLCLLCCLWLSFIKSASCSLFVRVTPHLQCRTLGNCSRVLNRALWGRFDKQFYPEPTWL